MQIFCQQRNQGEFHNLLQEMRVVDPLLHFHYLGMSKQTFDCLLAEVAPFLSRKYYNSSVRAEVSPAERLAVTSRYLTTGNSQVLL